MLLNSFHSTKNLHRNIEVVTGTLYFKLIIFLQQHTPKCVIPYILFLLSLELVHLSVRLVLISLVLLFHSSEVTLSCITSNGDKLSKIEQVFYSAWPSRNVWLCHSHQPRLHLRDQQIRA